MSGFRLAFVPRGIIRLSLCDSHARGVVVGAMHVALHGVARSVQNHITVAVFGSASTILEAPDELKLAD